MSESRTVSKTAYQRCSTSTQLDMVPRPLAFPHPVEGGEENRERLGKTPIGASAELLGPPNGDDRRHVNDDGNAKQHENHTYENGVGPASSVVGDPEATDPGDAHHHGERGEGNADRGTERVEQSDKRCKDRD